MNYHWKQFPVCRDCGRYRSHDNHKPFETCNRENEPCLKPEKHHQFAPKPVAAEEPRLTIVRGMALAWQTRNRWYRNARACAQLDPPGQEMGTMTNVYLAYEWRDREALASIRRIWHAVRDGDYL